MSINLYDPADDAAREAQKLAARQRLAEQTALEQTERLNKLLAESIDEVARGPVVELRLPVPVYKGTGRPLEGEDRVRAEQMLTESTSDGFGQIFDIPSRELQFQVQDLIHPNFQTGLRFMDDMKRGDLLPVYINEWQLRYIRLRSRHLAYFNEFCICGVENRVNYVVGDGFTYAVNPKDPANKSHKEAAKACQVIVDKFVELNELCEVEAEAMARYDVDGEAFLRLFTGNRNGILSARFVEPEHIRSKNGQSSDPKYSYGVETDGRDIETPTGFSVVENPNFSWIPETVDAGDIVHIKANVPRRAKRGLPTFFPVHPNLVRCEQLLQAMTHMAKVRAKIALIRQLTGVSSEQAQTMLNRLTSVRITSLDGRADIDVENIMPGTIPTIPANMKIEAPHPNLGSSDFVSVLQAELRAVASRIQMPEWMFTAVADAKYSNAFVVEAPTLKAFKRLQRRFVQAFGSSRYGPRKSLVWRQLTYAAENGLIPAEYLELVNVECKGPPLESRDKSADSQRAQGLVQSRLSSKRTQIQELGYDPEEEQRLIAAETVGERRPVGDLSAVQQIQSQYYTGQLPKPAAVALVVTILGYPQATAESLFPGEPTPQPGPGGMPSPGGPPAAGGGGLEEIFAGLGSTPDNTGAAPVPSMMEQVEPGIWRLSTEWTESFELALLEAADPNKPRFTGRIVDSRGRVYYYVDGKRVKKDDASDVHGGDGDKDAAAARGAKDAANKLFKLVKDGNKLTDEQMKDLPRLLAVVPMNQLKEMAKTFEVNVKATLRPEYVDAMLKAFPIPEAVQSQMAEPSTPEPAAEPSIEGGQTMTGTSDPTAKEPWQMGVSDFINHLEANPELAKKIEDRYPGDLMMQHRQYVAAAVKAGKDVPVELKRQVDAADAHEYTLAAYMHRRLIGKKVHPTELEGVREGIKDAHREAVEQALADGKTVPPEVLADYPDLAPQPSTAVPDDMPPAPPGREMTDAERAEAGEAALRDEELSRVRDAEQKAKPRAIETEDLPGLERILDRQQRANDWAGDRPDSVVAEEFQRRTQGELERFQNSFGEEPQPQRGGAGTPVGAEAPEPAAEAPAPAPQSPDPTKTYGFKFPKTRDERKGVSGGLEHRWNQAAAMTRPPSKKVKTGDYIDSQPELKAIKDQVNRNLEHLKLGATRDGNEPYRVMGEAEYRQMHKATEDLIEEYASKWRKGGEGAPDPAPALTGRAAVEPTPKVAEPTPETSQGTPKVGDGGSPPPTVPVTGEDAGAGSSESQKVIPDSLLTYGRMELMKQPKQSWQMTENDRKKHFKKVVASMAKEFGSLKKTDDIVARAGGLHEGTNFNADDYQKAILDELSQDVMKSHADRPNMPKGFSHLSLLASNIGVPESLLAEHMAKQGAPPEVLADYPDLAAKYAQPGASGGSPPPTGSEPAPAPINRTEAAKAARKQAMSSYPKFAYNPKDPTPEAMQKTIHENRRKQAAEKVYKDTLAGTDATAPASTPASSTPSPAGVSGTVAKVASGAGTSNASVHAELAKAHNFDQAQTHDYLEALVASGAAEWVPWKGTLYDMPTNETSGVFFPRDTSQKPAGQYDESAHGKNSIIASGIKITDPAKAADVPLPERMPPAKSAAAKATLLKSLKAIQAGSPWGVPMGEAYEAVKREHPELTHGQFKQLIREEFTNRKGQSLRTSGWAKTLYEIPNPDLAMMVNDKVMYYLDADEGIDDAIRKHEAASRG